MRFKAIANKIYDRWEKVFEVGSCEKRVGLWWGCVDAVRLSELSRWSLAKGFVLSATSDR
jgi:hypothetical protein